MASEVLRELITDSSGTYVDATIGTAGHAELIVERLGEGGRLIGFDRDREAVDIARARLSRFGDRATIVHRDYRHLGEVCRELGIRSISGALIDLGLSSVQLDNPDRGFSYQLDGPLDLRFDRSSGKPASAWLNEVPQAAIASVLFEYGEEARARQIARRIASVRQSRPITTTGQLREIIIDVVGKRGSVWGRAAARCFQAIRVYINLELDAIPAAVGSVLDLLVQRGRLVIIAYHSVEDRIVKDLLHDASRRCNCPPAYPGCICGANPVGRKVYRRVLRPTSSEVTCNPRSRAARMRVFEKDIAAAVEGAR
jgi:16S rRNA (cytosine1402-N4)-methyltransferase